MVVNFCFYNLVLVVDVVVVSVVRVGASRVILISNTTLSYSRFSLVVFVTMVHKFTNCPRDHLEGDGQTLQEGEVSTCLLFHRVNCYSTL